MADLYGFRYWFASEAKIDKLVELETSAPGTLETVILYHAVSGQIDSATALSVPRGTPLTTLQGGDIKVNPYPRFGTAKLVDNGPDDVNPFLVRSKLDIQASNGIAHGIGFVLRPVDLRSDEHAVVEPRSVPSRPGPHHQPGEQSRWCQVQGRPRAPTCSPSPIAPGRPQIATGDPFPPPWRTVLR